MQYRWEEFILDRESMLLMRRGHQIDISRKVLDCISHLVKHRQRVVGYDELIRNIWGHDDVTNHQLSQVILAARRTVGDDGQSQRLIRTMPGLGYRWVGEVIEAERTEIAASASALVSENRDAPPSSIAPIAPDVQFPARAPDPTKNATRQLHSKAIALGLLLFIFIGAGAYLMLTRPGSDPPVKPPSVPADQIAALNDALRNGNFEAVREGLETLPPHMADTPDARILEIELDFYRGRLTRAVDKTESLLSQPETIADPIFHTRLLNLKGRLMAKMNGAPAEILSVAQSAIELIESAGSDAPPQVRALALEGRATALTLTDRPDEALRDLAVALDLYMLSGDTGRATSVKANIARAWTRIGRLQDALNASREAAEAYRHSGDRIDEIFTLNTITRIQMELLRWDDALASNDRSMRVLREVPDAERRYRSLQLRALALTAKGQFRLAASQLEEAAGLRFENEKFTIPAFHLLESGDAFGALKAAQAAFDSKPGGDNAGILLDNKDGSLLLWVTAAQKLAVTGVAMPAPSPEQRQHLQNPQTTLGRLASGRWLWSQGKRGQAETELRRALDESRRMNHFFRMSLAAEPLVELLLQNGDVTAAQTIVNDLRAFDPERMDNDYRVNLLRLRVALATEDPTAVQVAHRKTRALAGERKLPPEVMARLSALNSDAAKSRSKN